MPDAAATLLSCLAAGIFALLCVYIGFVLSRLATEGDRRKEALFTIYQNVETLKNLLVAIQKRMIDVDILHPKWTRATENVLLVLIRSGLKSKEIKRVLVAINGKWEDPKSVIALTELGEELLKKLDREYAQAAKEFLDDLGVKPEDINPTILRTTKE
jgi:hypothetical protein